jgi:hypothetical protein
MTRSALWRGKNGGSGQRAYGARTASVVVQGNQFRIRNEQTSVGGFSAEVAHASVHS